MWNYLSIVFVCLRCDFVESDNTVEKRILVSDPQYVHTFELTIQQLTAKVDSLEIKHQTEIKALQADNIRLESELSHIKTHQFQGGTYTRWGRTICPSVNGTDIVYAGYAGGSWFQHTGGASNHLCMPTDPEFLDHQSPGGYVYGVEYEKNFNGHTIDEDVPCAVCRTNRPSVLMIPARLHCHSGWTIDYVGILVSGYYGSGHTNTEYLCLDSSPEAIAGGEASKNGALLYYVNSKCGSLPCPPYHDEKTLPCVVCSK